MLTIFYVSFEIRFLSAIYFICSLFYDVIYIHVYKFELLISDIITYNFKSLSFLRNVIN